MIKKFKTFVNESKQINENLTQSEIDDNFDELLGIAKKLSSKKYREFIGIEDLALKIWSLSKKYGDIFELNSRKKDFKDVVKRIKNDNLVWPGKIENFTAQTNRESLGIEYYMPDREKNYKVDLTYSNGYLKEYINSIKKSWVNINKERDGQISMF